MKSLLTQRRRKAAIRHHSFMYKHFVNATEIRRPKTTFLSLWNLCRKPDLYLIINAIPRRKLGSICNTNEKHNFLKRNFNRTTIFVYFCLQGKTTLILDEAMIKWCFTIIFTLIQRGVDHKISHVSNNKVM